MKVPPNVYSCIVAVLMVAGFIASLNVAVTSVLVLESVALLGGLTATTVGGSDGALAKSTSTQ
jgi:hypothetical protein